jgi:hypothetical protein
MGIETKFVEILGRVRMWKINADYLTLMDEQEVPLALFRAVFIEKR